MQSVLNASFWSSHKELWGRGQPHPSRQTTKVELNFSTLLLASLLYPFTTCHTHPTQHYIMMTSSYYITDILHHYDITPIYTHWIQERRERVLFLVNRILEDGGLQLGWLPSSKPSSLHRKACQINICMQWSGVYTVEPQIRDPPR